MRSFVKVKPLTMSLDRPHVSITTDLFFPRETPRSFSDRFKTEQQKAKFLSPEQREGLWAVLELGCLVNPFFFLLSFRTARRAFSLGQMASGIGDLYEHIGHVHSSVRIHTEQHEDTSRHAFASVTPAFLVSLFLLRVDT